MSAHVSDRMSAYVDRELPPPERAAVDAHLRECPECARGVEELRAVDALARGHEVLAPEGYFDELPGRLRARLAPRRHARVPAWTVALAAGLAVAVLAPLALRQASGPAPRAQVALPAPPDARSGTPASPGSGAPAQAAPAPAAPPAETRSGLDRRAESTARPERAAPAAKSEAEAKSRREAPPPGAAAAPSAGRFDETTREASADLAQAEEDEEEDATPLVSDDSAPPRRAAAAPAAAPDAGAVAPPPPPARPGAEARLRSLSNRTLRSAADARALRDAWQAFVREDPEGPHADEARLRALEAGAAAWRLGGRREDRAQVERDAREYLRREQGAHKERVRALLAGLEP